jgi:hypothetical protein
MKVQRLTRSHYPSQIARRVHKWMLGDMGGAPFPPLAAVVCESRQGAPRAASSKLQFCTLSFGRNVTSSQDIGKNLCTQGEPEEAAARIACKQRCTKINQKWSHSRHGRTEWRDWNRELVEGEL